MKNEALMVPMFFAAMAATKVAHGAENVLAPWKPVLQFRVEGRHTESDEAWAKTFGMFKECPGLCDEIWFGTGFGMPTLEKHREYAARIGRASKDVASLGWTASLMFQATVGHGGPFCEGYDYSGRDWTGWTGSTGVEDKYCSCPRDPRFLSYMRAVARIYAANHPASVWIDDDLRIDNHDPATRGGGWLAAQRRASQPSPRRAGACPASPAQRPGRRDTRRVARDPA